MKDNTQSQTLDDHWVFEEDSLDPFICLCITFDMSMVYDV